MDIIKRVSISFILFTVCIGLFWFGYQETDSQPPSVTATDLPPKPKPSQLVLSAAGDVLLHEQVYNDARIDVEQFDFTPMFSAIKPYIEQADVSFVNQESNIGGIELGLSTYPAFNSPVEIAHALKETGFDVINLANNHALDRGEQALRGALLYWDELGLIRTGAYLSEEDRNHIRTLTKNEITLSFLSYTYGTNGIAVPKPYLVNLINKEQMQKDIEQAKQASDAIIVNLHFGNEYETMPNEAQQELAQFLSDLGVAVIFGHHPHVLQPPAFLTGKSGNRTFVFYSLGNFLAGQQNEETWVGGITNITIKKDAQANIELAHPSFLPTFIYSQHEEDYRVLPLEQVTSEQYRLVNDRYQSVVTHMKTFIPDLHIIQTITE